jgi:hypothetical protein
VKWPFSQRKPTDVERPDPKDSQEALERARRAHEETARLAPEVRELAETLRRRRQDNHFGRGWVRTLKRGH